MDLLQEGLDRSADATPPKFCFVVCLAYPASPYLVSFPNSELSHPYRDGIINRSLKSSQSWVQ